jgi:hypothetical protein
LQDQLCTIFLSNSIEFEFWADKQVEFSPKISNRWEEPKFEGAESLGLLTAIARASRPTAVVPSLADTLRAPTTSASSAAVCAGDDAAQGLLQLRYAPRQTPLCSSQFPHFHNPNALPPQLPLPDARAKSRKRKRAAASASPSKQPDDHSDDSDTAAAANGDDETSRAASVNGGGGTLAGVGGDDDPVLDLRAAEVLSSSAEPVSAFPAAVRRAVSRPHPSVLAVIAAERAAASSDDAPVTPASVPVLENISHGQLQVISAMLPDHPSLSYDPDKPSTYVCTPPPLMEGCGVHKQFYDKLHIVPRHSGFFLAQKKSLFATDHYLVLEQSDNFNCVFFVDSYL